MKTYIGTPKGEIIIVNLNLKRGRIQSRTRKGISKLREYGWNILKKRKYFDKGDFGKINWKEKGEQDEG